MKSNILRALAMVMLLIVVACGGGISEESYDDVKPGMTLEEVKGLLGGPTSTDGVLDVEVMGKKLSGGIYSWKDGAKVIKVTIADNKVTLKSNNGF